LTKPRFKNKEFVLLLIGPSGSGKGTQAIFLKKHISKLRIVRTGPMLRKLAKRDTLTAKFLGPYLQKGLLVPGWLASFTWMKVVFESVLSGENLLFDGAPRQITEAKLLDEVMSWHKMPLPRAIFLDIDRKESQRRLMLRGRSDDTAEAIRERLKFYYKNVIPVISYFEKNKRLIRINGEQEPEKVAEDIKKALRL